MILNNNNNNNNNNNHVSEAELFYACNENLLWIL